MDFESPPTQNDKDLEKEAKYKAFEELFDHTLQNKGEGVPMVEYNLTYPKEDFLKFLVENKNVLLHGSASQDLEVIEPTVITGPKTVKIEMGRDDIFYDNKNRRLYILRPEVGSETTKSYAPSDIDTQKGKW